MALIGAAPKLIKRAFLGLPRCQRTYPLAHLASNQERASPHGPTLKFWLSLKSRFRVVGPIWVSRLTAPDEMAENGNEMWDQCALALEQPGGRPTGYR